MSTHPEPATVNAPQPAVAPASESAPTPVTAPAEPSIPVPQPAAAPQPEPTASPPALSEPMPVPMVHVSAPASMPTPAPAPLPEPVTLQDLGAATLASARQEATANAHVQRAEGALHAFASGPPVDSPPLTPGEPLSASRVGNVLLADAQRRAAGSAPVQLLHAGVHTALHGAPPPASPGPSSPPLDGAMLRDAALADAHRRVAGSAPVGALHGLLTAVAEGPHAEPASPPLPEKTGFWGTMGSAVRDTFVHEGHRMLAGNAYVQGANSRLSSYMGEHPGSPTRVRSPPGTPGPGTMRSGTYPTAADSGIRRTMSPVQFADQQPGPSARRHASTPGPIAMPATSPAEYAQHASGRRHSQYASTPGGLNASSPAEVVERAQELGLPPNLQYLPAPATAPITAPALAYLDEPGMRPRGSRMFSTSTRRSGALDWVLPVSVSEAGSDGEKTLRNAHGLAYPTERGTLAERLVPTLLHAKEQQIKYRTRSYYTGLAVSIAIGLQVLLGALTTGISAALPGRNSSIATSILGGILTLLASYLAKVRGTNEPELSRGRAKEFSNFIRDVDAALQDRGWLKNKPKPGETEQEAQDEIDFEVAYFRKRFEDLMGSMQAKSGQNQYQSNQNQNQSQNPNYNQNPNHNQNQRPARPTV